MDGWVPSVVTTTLFGLALWLGRNLVATRLRSTVEHEFNTKLQALQSELRQKEEITSADLRAKEREIADLRSGAMSAMTSRQVEVDKRRLEAIDQLWSAVSGLAGAKGISALMGMVKFRAVADEAARNENLRRVFEAFGSGFDTAKVDLSGAAKARPFLSPLVWALFSAYHSIAMQAVMKLNVIKHGIGAKDFIDNDVVAKLVKAALPHHAQYVDKYGDSGYHYLMNELETTILAALRKMLTGDDTDRESVERAAEILRLSNELTVKQSEAQTNSALQGMRGGAECVNDLRQRSDLI